MTTITLPTRAFFYALTLLSCASRIGGAQAQRFNYPEPKAGSVIVDRERGYAAGDRHLMDIYRPAARGRFPAVIFFNVAPTTQRGAPLYTGWARTVASQGIVGIVPDLRPDSAAPDFEKLLAHLVQRAADYGIDGAAIAVYAGSGNASTALPLLEDPRQRTVKAAVIYYGRADITEFRRDLPVLLVRAGLDRPQFNARVAALAALAISANAPLTLLNHSTGHHAFEILDPGPETRDVIDRTIQFVRKSLAPAYQASLRAGLAEATAAALVQRAQFRDAAAIYADLVAGRPGDALLGLAYGEALLGDAQYVAACSAFDALKAKALGPRDVGLPAAEACAKAGNPEAAIAWLRAIPPRFLPRTVASDPAFAALRGRDDFRALFGPGGG